ncbi:MULTISPECIES: iron-siderophore ABC transporter substrate-binding protein [unclassified Motilimonas]|uniref:iron-siderophore ABC transporter substrate-binding protein n=1 Tax=unclassified Motilimonas TaxID=2643697 RepID=UPI001E552B3E|nr:MULTISPECIES: iron-siderophore ABC transporter substrate-binding protein [unclassified Motilimonas]MCE0556996.1 iron-siderophore ABC transporter substrate-binding protein [Motilimonas sp. E26]MDO6527280.1 iron-siderophore ABC transporter substrate-binding protein [Motilimonas sp. 1_MG-2023]
MLIKYLAPIDWLKSKNKFTQSITLATLVFCLLFSWSIKAEIWVEDSDGKHSFTSHPVRVAALNWDIAEQVIELGVTPIAMPDLTGYEQWVVTPAIPEGVEDIGARIEPNIEKLMALKPDVILIAAPQKDLASRLEKIAPVLFYQTYSESHDNAAAAVDNFRKIAQLLDKTALAEQKLQAMEARLDELRSALLTAYDGNLPQVKAIRFASVNSVYVYGENSIPQYALSKLGVVESEVQPRTQWGIAQKRITALQQFSQHTVLYFEPFEYRDKLAESRVWQAMPFVQQQRFNRVAATWSYGGAMSILYNAEALSQSLLELAPR